MTMTMPCLSLWGLGRQPLASCTPASCFPSRWGGACGCTRLALVCPRVRCIHVGSPSPDLPRPEPRSLPDARHTPRLWFPRPPPTKAFADRPRGWVGRSIDAPCFLPARPPPLHSFGLAKQLTATVYEGHTHNGSKTCNGLVCFRVTFMLCWWVPRRVVAPLCGCACVYESGVGASGGCVSAARTRCMACFPTVFGRMAQLCARALCDCVTA